MLTTYNPLPDISLEHDSAAPEGSNWRLSIAYGEYMTLEKYDPITLNYVKSGMDNFPKDLAYTERDLIMSLEKAMVISAKERAGYMASNANNKKAELEENILALSNEIEKTNIDYEWCLALASFIEIVQDPCIGATRGLNKQLEKSFAPFVKRLTVKNGDLVAYDAAGKPYAKFNIATKVGSGYHDDDKSITYQSAYRWALHTIRKFWYNYSHQ